MLVVLVVEVVSLFFMASLFSVVDVLFAGRASAGAAQF